ncbi:TPA: helix-turn-helix domain-containing protein [Enterococcus faecalis]
MNTGKIIHFYREEKGLTQSELAEGICSQGEISLIEQDKRVPSFELIVKISAKLDIPIYYFLNDTFQSSTETVLNTVFSQLESFVNKRNYKSMGNFVLDNFIFNYCITSNDKQQFLCFKGIYTTYYEKNPKKALSIYKQGLLETFTLLSTDPIIISKRKKVYSKTETFLLSATATCYFLLGNHQYAKNLFELACTNIELIQKQSSVETFGTIYYNASKNLKALKNYSKAIDIAKKGVIFERERNSIYRSSELLFEIAESYYLLNNYIEAEKYYIKSICLAFSTNNTHFLILLIPALEEKEEFQTLKKIILCIKHSL